MVRNTSAYIPLEKEKHCGKENGSKKKMDKEILSVENPSVKNENITFCKDLVEKVVHKSILFSMMRFDDSSEDLSLIHI